MRAARSITALAIAAGALAASAAAPARADELGRVVAVLAGEGLPAGLGVAEVHLPSTLAGLDVAPEAVTVVWPTAPHAGRVSARVVVRGTGGARKAWVPITLAQLAPVVVAARELAVGDVIGESDVRREQRAASHAAAPADALGARVTAAVAAGAVIDADAIAPAPPVARGTEVAVRIHRPGFTISAHGTLDRSARPGAAAVVHLGTRAIVHGTLIDAGTVEVQGDAP